MTDRMKFVFKGSFKCECCKSYKMGGEQYKWILFYSKKELLICKKCALREAFGTDYKKNKKYIQWMERRSNDEQ
tara:strand:- start:1749 stop:1970 length:222 start_codon:yes stop_codon:yes gene_type:complete